jgi:hypothetical protein
MDTASCNLHGSNEQNDDGPTSSLFFSYIHTDAVVLIDETTNQSPQLTQKISKNMA